MHVIVSNPKHANLIFKNDSKHTLSVSFDDNCGALKERLGRAWVLIWDANEKDFFSEEWVSSERFLEILADFYSKKIVDKAEN